MIAIVRRTTSVVTFVALLTLPFSTAQRQHLERFTDLLIMAPRRKTLAEMAKLELSGVDASNLADFFRISPWDADDVRLGLIEFILYDLKARIKDPTLPIFLTLDDSLTPKDKATHKLQSVDWHFDHNRHQTVKGGNHVVLRIHWGDFHYPLVWRLYLRASTVRRLNQRRKNTNKLQYRSKLALARQMLEQIQSRLPAQAPVYVLFDSWYTSAKLVKWIRQQGWHVIAGLKSNRIVSGKKLAAWHHELKGRSYDKVSLELANGRKRTYGVRSIRGRLHGVPGDVRVLLSQTGPGARAPKHFLCTDLDLSAQEILSRYQHRWRQEIFQPDYRSSRTLYLGGVAA
jgi:DDE superfamily endonuclease